MTGEAEAAGDALTGALVARTVEGDAGAQTTQRDVPGVCRNCGAPLSGAYCSTCGQAARIHRSLLSLGHDILHGVFHFEGKFWRTIPELFFHPGRLTRRYIDGERAKFVSPMALFLFTVFLMFAVFSFTAGTALDGAGETADTVAANWKSGNASAIEATNEKIEALQEQIEDDDVSAVKKAELQREIAELKSARSVMEALAAGDWERVTELKAAEEKAQAAAEQAAAPDAPKQQMNLKLGLGWPALEQRLNEGVRQAQQNPGLLFYKLKINGYKFSWALIPLSVPVLWLLFFWRRDIHLYDHAIFATYSISFMMLLLIALAIAASLGVSAGIWGTALGVIPPIHMYKQLRGAYGLSRFGASVRLFLLLIAIVFVLTIFGVLLLVIGVLG
jgi:hypothetical protein